jgi:hypothetical protein
LPWVVCCRSQTDASGRSFFDVARIRAAQGGRDDVSGNVTIPTVFLSAVLREGFQGCLDAFERWVGTLPTEDLDFLVFQFVGRLK